MLPICLGETTEFSQFLLDADKRYVVTANWVNLLDMMQKDKVVETRSVDAGNLSTNLAALEQFRVTFCKLPTMFSALKHNGKPLYMVCSRRHLPWNVKHVPITIFELNFINYQAFFNF